jgi:hypothetical protein
MRLAVFIKKALSDQLSHGSNISLMDRLIILAITSRRKVAKISLTVTKMLHHVRPSAINERAPIPEAKILLENGLLREDNICKINHLLSSHGRTSMISEFREIVDAVEDCVNWLRDVIMHIVVKFHLFCLDLLRGNFTVGFEEVCHESTDADRVLTCGSIEQGA